MWCLVVLPNSIVMEIQVDSKAKGQECLDKVSQPCFALAQFCISFERFFFPENPQCLPSNFVGLISQTF